MWFQRRDKWQHKIFGHNFCLVPKSKLPIQMYYTTTHHVNIKPEGKTRVPAAVSRFRAENRVFDHLDKILYCSTGLRGENSFYCGSIWPRLILIHKKSNFWNRKFFHVRTGQNVIFFFRGKKNQVPPLAPNFWWFPHKISIKMSQNFK